MVGDSAAERLSQTALTELLKFADDGRTLDASKSLGEALASLVMQPLASGDRKPARTRRDGRMVIKLGPEVLFDRQLEPARHASRRYADSFNRANGNLDNDTLADGSVSSVWSEASAGDMAGCSISLIADLGPWFLMILYFRILGLFLLSHSSYRSGAFR